MKKEKFAEKVNTIIDSMTKLKGKEDLKNEVLDCLTTGTVTKKQCNEVKLLLKKKVIAKAKIAEQDVVAAKVETLCNKYRN